MSEICFEKLSNLSLSLQRKLRRRYALKVQRINERFQMCEQLLMKMNVDAAMNRNQDQSTISAVFINEKGENMFTFTKFVEQKCGKPVETQIKIGFRSRDDHVGSGKEILHAKTVLVQPLLLEQKSACSFGCTMQHLNNDQIRRSTPKIPFPLTFSIFLYYNQNTRGGGGGM